MEFHPIASLFPLIEGEAFDKLCADVQANGLLEPIWLYEGKILDGRNRYRACEAAVVTPTYRTYEGTDPVGHSISLNLHRRHLSVGQVAAVGIASLDFYRTEATKRLEAAQQLPGGDRKSGAAKIEPPQICGGSIAPGAGGAVVQAAKALGISEGTLQGALKVQKADPALFAEVKEGKRTVGGAVNELRKREGKEPYGLRKREPVPAKPASVPEDARSRGIATQTPEQQREYAEAGELIEVDRLIDRIDRLTFRSCFAKLIDHLTLKLKEADDAAE